MIIDFALVVMKKIVSATKLAAKNLFLVVLVILFAPNCLVKAEDNSGFFQLIKKLSNWERWGKDDELGTLNLITPQVRVSAAKEVIEGISVSLSRTADTRLSIYNSSPYSHNMIAYGGKPIVDGKANWSTDQFVVNYHGYAHTHIDALCHLFEDGKMYNSFDKNLVTKNGAKKLSIIGLKNGIFTRGVLLDIPAMKKAKWLKRGYAVTTDDLDEFEEWADIKIKKGDAVFLRTGRWAQEKEKGPWNVSKSTAGFHYSCMEWFAERDIALIGSDAALEVAPSGIKDYPHPVHLLALHSLGMNIFDNCDLWELSKNCNKLNRFSFLLTASPLAVNGATGSPLNPIANF